MFTILPRSRSRYRQTYSAKGQYRTSGLGAWIPYEIYGGLSETIVDQSPHLQVWNREVRSDGDAGGPLSLSRSGVLSATTVPIYVGNGLGDFSPGATTGHTVGDTVYPPFQGSVGDLNAYGTSAVARAIPTNPIFSLSTALGELRSDGLPSLPGTSVRDRTALTRKAGNEYLNVEFGWLPLVSDIRRFAFAVRNSHKLIAQYRRDADRKIRRRAGGPRYSYTGVKSGPGSLYPNAAGVSTTYTVDETRNLNYWFSGAFKYHIPIGDDTWSKLSRYEQYSNYLLGTRITPEVLWNVAPWSWAVDWFTNTGDVMTNISRLGSDGLVMQYGYAMRHDRLVSTTTHVTNGFGFSGVPAGLSCKLVEVVEFKQRVVANPYGFGVDDLSLSQRQLAILAALGLSKDRRYR